MARPLPPHPVQSPEQRLPPLPAALDPGGLSLGCSGLRAGARLRCHSATQRADGGEPELLCTNAELAEFSHFLATSATKVGIAPGLRRPSLSLME